MKSKEILSIGLACFTILSISKYIYNKYFYKKEQEKDFEEITNEYTDSVSEIYNTNDLYSVYTTDTDTNTDINTDTDTNTDIYLYTDTDMDTDINYDESCSDL